MKNAKQSISIIHNRKNIDKQVTHAHFEDITIQELKNKLTVLDI